jgi:hypothetical protein
MAFRRRRNSAYSFNVKTITLIMSVAVFISFLSVVMLVNFNKVSTKGYTIKYLEVQNRQLWEEHELLKKELLQKKALSSLNVTEKASNMIKPGQITYTTGHTALAHNTE